MQTGWQDIAAFAAVASAVLFLGRKVVATFTGKKSGGCGTCNTCPETKNAGAPPLVRVESLLDSLAERQDRG